MAIFDLCYQRTLDFEDPNRTFNVRADNVGQTIAGINSKAFPKQFHDIGNAPYNQREGLVRQFYYRDIWLPSNCEVIINQDLANNVFDACFNMGVKEGIKILQGSANSCSLSSLNTDGILGPKTQAVINCVPFKMLFYSFITFRISAYYDIAKNINASKDDIMSWINRTIN